MKFDINKLNLKRKIIRQYIHNNPQCTYLDIKRDTKIKIERIYKNMKEAYKDAKIKLSRNLIKRDKVKQKIDAINFIKNNPLCTVTEIQNKTKINIIRLFGSIVNAYEAAGIKYSEKESTSGVVNPSVAERCHKFEKRIVKLLGNLGEVKPKIRTSVGIVDCLFKYHGNIFVVEIKDFRGKNNITMFEIKQLIRYMDALNYRNGLLICPKESFPKRKNGRNIYIGNRTIKIISEEDLRGCSIKVFNPYNLASTAGSSCWSAEAKADD